MNFGIILALIALVALGLSSALSRNPVRKIGPNQVMFFRGIFDSVILLLLVISFHSFTTFSLKYTLIALLISALGFIPLFFFYKAIEIGKIGVISPISSTYAVITIALAVIFYHEHLSAFQFLSVALIIFGIVFISINFRQFKHSHLFDIKSGIPYGLIALAGWGLYFFLVRIPTVHLGSVLVSFVTEFGILAVATALIFAKREKITLPDSRTLWNILFISVSLVAGVICLYQGLKIYNVSIVTAIGSATPLIVVSYSFLFFKEKLTLQQLGGFLMIVLGIISISLIR